MRWFVLCGALLLAVSPVVAQDLMVPVATAGGSGISYFAYSDGTVWYTLGGYLLELPCANRGVPVRAMIPYGGFAIYVLYDDNQVWTIGWTTGCTFSGDLTRPDNPSIRPVSISTGAEFVATYEDGQVWAGPTNLHRVEMWERLNPVSSTDEPMPAPTSARPAPFSSSCTINLELPAAGPAAVRVFDVAGREIRALLEAELPAGACSIVWDGRDDAGQPAPAGVYFARVEAAGRAESVRLVLAH